MYKYDQEYTQPHLYLNFPAGENIFAPSYLSTSTMDSLTAAADAMAKLAPTKDSFTVKSSLFSTMLTQDTSVINLIHWRTALYRNRSEISHILKDVELIGEMEIMKFFPSIIFAILDIFAVSAQKNTRLCELITPSLIKSFEVLILILNVSNDPRFKSQMKQVQPIFDRKLDELPKNLIASILAKRISGLLLDSSDEGHKNLRKSLKVLHLIFKIIILTSTDASETILGIIEDIFIKFNSKDVTENGIVCQILVLQHFPQFLNEVYPVLKKEQLLKIINSIMYESSTLRINLKIFRLNAMKSILTLHPFCDSDDIFRAAMSTILMNLVDIDSKIIDDGCRYF